MAKNKTAKTEETTEDIVMATDEPSYEELKARNAELEATLVQKEEELAKKSGQAGRKEEVLAYLQEHGHVKVADIAKAIGISDRNVSSQLTYLRKAGYAIATDSRGFKFLESQPEPEEAE